MYQAILLASGPSLDAFDQNAYPEAFVMAVNFAGANRKTDAVSIVDVWRGGILESVYPFEMKVFCVERGPSLHNFKNVVCLPECPVRIRTSAAGLGLYALYIMGYRKILGVGLDMHFSDKFDHAKSLVDRGFYNKEAEETCLPLRAAIQYAMNDLSLELEIFKPPFKDASDCYFVELTALG